MLSFTYCIGCVTLGFSDYDLLAKRQRILTAAKEAGFDRTDVPGELKQHALVDGFTESANPPLS